MNHWIRSAIIVFVLGLLAGSQCVGQQFIITERHQDFIVTDRVDEPTVIKEVTIQNWKPKHSTTQPAPVFELQIWTATWCTACPGGKIEAKAAAKSLGLQYHEFDYDKLSKEARRAGVTRLPTVCICSHLGIHDRIVGGNRSEIAMNVRRLMRAWGVENPPAATTKTTVSQSRNPSLFGRRGTSHESRETLIQHLANEGIHRGKWSAAELQGMSDDALDALHSKDHGWSR